MIRWGIIGTGNIAQRFIASLAHSEQGILTAIASHKEETRKRFSCIKTYAKYQDLLEDPQIDAVYIGLPHRFHAEWSIRALTAKKAVLCEKPAVLTQAEIAAIKTAALQHQCFFMEAMKTWFTPAFAVLKETVRSGVIGEVSQIDAAFCSDGALRGQVRPDSYLFEAGQGGSWNDVGPYPLAFALAFFKGMPETITAEFQRQGEIDVHALARLEFAGGKMAKLETAIDRKKERTAIITGTQGSIRVPLFNRMESFEIIKNDQRQTITVPLLVDDFFGQIEEVHRCLKAHWLESPVYPWQQMERQAMLLEAIRQAGG